MEERMLGQSTQNMKVAESLALATSRRWAAAKEQLDRLTAEAEQAASMLTKAQQEERDAWVGLEEASGRSTSPQAARIRPY